MATAITHKRLEEESRPFAPVASDCGPAQPASNSNHQSNDRQESSQRHELQGLLAFGALSEQVRRKTSLRIHSITNDGTEIDPDFKGVRLSLDEMLQIVADRAAAITGADGLAIALPENDEIVLRTGAGKIHPDFGARIDRDSAFSGASLSTAQILKCDDTEVDARVDRQLCRRLGARSMVAVPLCRWGHEIGLLQAFSAQPLAFDDRDVRALGLLAELAARAIALENELHSTENQIAAMEIGTAPSVPGTIQFTDCEITTGEASNTNRRFTVRVLLVCVLIALALWGRLWWRLNSPQRAKNVQRTEKVRQGTIGTAAKDASASLSVNATATSANRIPIATFSPHETSSPAKARELSKFPMVTGAEHKSSGDSSTVVLSLEDQVQYEAHRLVNPQRIYLDLHKTALASDLAFKSIDVGDALLKRVRIAQPVTGTTRIVLDTKANPEFSVTLEPNPCRLVIELRKDRQAQ